MRFISCTAGDAIIAGQFYRAAFEPGVVGTLASLIGDSQSRARVANALYSELRAGEQIPYASPVNDAAEALTDDRVYVFDLRMFATPESVGAFAQRLEALYLATSLRSLERVQQTAVYGPAGAAGRAVAKQLEEEKRKEESLTQRALELLKQLGVVVLVILALMVAIVAHKAYREYVG